MTDASESWRDEGDNMGLEEETVRIEVYCNYRDKETWKREAREQRYGSLSKYLRDMVNLGRAYQQQGYLEQQEANEHIRSLKSENERLKQQLADEDTNTEEPIIVNSDLVEAHLTEQYQSLDAILDRLTMDDDLRANLKTPVKTVLYDLTGDGRAEYQRGHGWRLGGSE